MNSCCMFNTENTEMLNISTFFVLDFIQSTHFSHWYVIMYLFACLQLLYVPIIKYLKAYKFWPVHLFVCLMFVFSKTLTLRITLEWLVIAISYFTYIFLVTRPFFLIPECFALNHKGLQKYFAADSDQCFTKTSCFLFIFFLFPFLYI